MQTTGIITSFNKDWKTGKAIVTLLLDMADMEHIEKLSKLKKLTITMKQFFKKRSKDANAYCWVLCDKIAKKLTEPEAVITKDDVYKNAILDMGTFEPMIIEEKAFDNFKRIWSKQGLGFLIQEVSRKDKCIKLHCYYGSSTYDTKEMSLLIELLVDLAKRLDIETKPKAEIESLLKEWDKK